MEDSYKIKSLNNKVEALEVINFFLKKGVFEQTWAPGEKTILKNSVINSLKNKKHQYYYIVDKGEVIGAIGIRENLYKSGGYEISEDYFAVANNYRRSGIGTILLQAIEKFVKKNHGRYIHILSCDTKYYEPARKFYETNKYKKVSHMPDYYVINEGRVDYYKKIGKISI